MTVDNFDKAFEERKSETQARIEPKQAEIARPVEPTEPRLPPFPRVTAPFVSSRGRGSRGRGRPSRGRGGPEHHRPNPQRR